VTQGERTACFFWVQSLVRDAGQREALFELDATIAGLRRDGADAAHVLALTALYHDLLRQWVDG